MIGRSEFGLYLGRLFGIRFYLDYYWFLMAAMIIYELAADILPASIPGHSHLAYYVMGVIAALTFFLSILLHELGHSLVSQRCGIPVPRITLMFIGGMAEISREPDTARAELKIAAGGPAVSIALVILYAGCACGAYLLGWDAASTICQWLALVNITLVVFNAIPGYPLDGGRVLRAIIWARTGNLRKATYIASRIGIGVGWTLIALGMVFCYFGWWNAFVPFVIGIFLKGAAETGYTNTLYHEVLGPLRAGDIMTRQPVCIPDRTPLNMALDDYFLAMHHMAFPVVNDSGDFRGLLRLDQLKELPPERWPYTTAGDFAADHNEISSTIDINQSAEYAMHRLASNNTLITVLDEGKVAGILTRQNVLRFIDIHTVAKRAYPQDKSVTQ